MPPNTAQKIPHDAEYPSLDQLAEGGEMRARRRTARKATPIPINDDDPKHLQQFQGGAKTHCPSWRRGVKYCDPCTRPSKLSGKTKSFKERFFDRGGLIAEIIEGGVITVGDQLIPPPKGY
jgi:hypothetical protein